ncbi:MAG TPA: hypothetical protein VGU72_25735 [Beijerinckiaceae bacterium]|jgi:hypothetical protein|nr:hypothetical protein [Beijerinckiaceae bacterium]
MKVGPKDDPRRTSPPEASRIEVASDGFALNCAGEIVFRMPWNQVQQIAGYTRFEKLAPKLCLAFSTSNRKKDQVVVHSGLLGWDELCAALPTFFPNCDRDWQKKAAHDATSLEVYAPVAAVKPVFTVNPTIVWSK